MTETAVAIPEKWKREIEDYEQKKYNILAPREIGQVPPMHTPRLSVVQVNPNPNGGDCYPLPGGGKVGLSKVALDRIAQAAGITWLPELSGRVDDGRDPHVVRYKAVGRIKDLTGTWRTILGEKEIDLVAIEDELRESVPKRDWIKNLSPDKRDKAIEDAIRSDLIQFRKHRLSRAQSGAMARAIRSALALRSQYTPEEVAKPFVIPKVVFTPDYNDPEVKRFMLAEATGHLSELYAAPGVHASLPAALPPVPEEELVPQAGQPSNGVAATDPPQAVQDGQLPWVEPDQKPEAPAAPPDAVVLIQESLTMEKKAGSAEVKAECVRQQIPAFQSLMVQKGYAANRLKKPLDRFDLEEREAFLKFLINVKAE